jgi:hypothetical protein
VTQPVTSSARGPGCTAGVPLTRISSYQLIIQS